MGDHLPTVRAAVVQAVPVFLDREATVEKACDLIRQSGSRGAEVVVFPEGFIPSHPVWYHFHAATGREALDMAADLFRNAVIVGSDATDRLAAAAREGGVWVVMGVCEKRTGTTGTLWNSALYLSPQGEVAGVHRKLTPTVGERLVHTGGTGEGLRAVTTPFGPVSSLLCAENSNPLLVFTVAAQYARIHAALWPNHFSPTQPRMRDVILSAGRAFAYRAGCYVLNAASTLDDETRRRVARTEEDDVWLREEANLGGSCILAPNGDVLAGPAGAEETILVADLDLDELVSKQSIHDFAGHYNRPDVLTLQIHDEPRPILDAPWTTGQTDHDHAEERDTAGGHEANESEQTTVDASRTPTGEVAP